MKKFLNFIIDNVKNILVLLLFVLTTFIIVWIIPDQTKFKYEYRKGEPWKYNSLFAPFDFPINKTPYEINKEKDSIQQNAPVFVLYDHQVYKNTLNYIKERIKDTIIIYNNVPQSLYYLISNEITQLYYKPGIINPKDTLICNTKNIKLVYIKNDTAINEYLNISFLTPEKADIQFSEFISSLNIKIPQYKHLFKPNIIINKLLTNQYQNQLIQTISSTKSMIEKGSKIIANGEIVSKEKYQILESFKTAYLKNTYNPYLIVGQILVVSLGLFMIFLFLYNFRKDILMHFTKTSFILSLIIIFVLAAKLINNWKDVSIYLFPFTLLPIIIRSFYDTRLALFVHNITMLIIAYFLPNSFEFLFMQFMAGITAIFVLANVRRRGQLFLAAFFILLSYSIIYFGISIIQTQDISEIKLSDFAWFGGNALMILSAYPLIYLFEKLFGFLSDVTLMELADVNTPLLRLLAEKAPGTFQHSIQVANLSEEIINRIGGNFLLARVGSLYHDIGKIGLPHYFIENQHHMPNPHKDLLVDKSIEIISGHVKYGVELAKKYNIPQPIIDFIESHHGTSTMQYFYKSYLKEHPTEKIDINQFRYKGKIPETKETAVVMLVDSIEAASHTLKDFSEEAIEKMINTIIDNKINEHQLDNAPITFKDISIIKNILIKRLKNIYHIRIEYPE